MSQMTETIMKVALHMRLLDPSSYSKGVVNVERVINEPPEYPAYSRDVIND